MEDQSKKNPSLSINEMWGLVKKQENWGIEGYEVPKYYHDATKQAITNRERDEKNNEHRRDWPPKNWPKNDKNKSIPPKRPNYLDQVAKWANSFYDPSKRDELIKTLNERTHPYDEKPKEPFVKNLRSDFLKNESEKLVIDKERAKADKERVKQAEEGLKTKHLGRETKTKEQAMKDKYKLYGSLPKGEKISILADAQYMGEQNPYYNTYLDPKVEEEKGDDDKDKKSNGKKLFYPSKTSTWRKAPEWHFNKIHKENIEEIKKRDLMFQEEMQKSFDNKTRKREMKHVVDVRGTFEKQENFKKIFFRYVKNTDHSNSSEHKLWKENYPDCYPGPQQYWKEPALNLHSKKKQNEDDEIRQTEEDTKTNYLSRAKTDRRIYKPMKQHLF